ncbi:MAG: indole-3-glycerol phosphate synthase TrpC [Deltaproteobacteria bacterium]|nr:indole-3-glycerol phosphate synthase TrpC [Deltaproteobacteria bacterium]
MSILREIVDYKKAEVEVLKKKRPIREEEIRARQFHHVFSRALIGPDKISIIAEIKRASPSLGPIRPSLEPGRIASIYEKNGAAAISVLTERHFFKGDIDYLPLIKKEVSLPILRKDFIIDSYQVYESNIYGADAILLIVSILPPDLLKDLIVLTNELGMEALVEVHNREELEKAILAGADIIGVNNRDLKTLKIDLNTSLELIKYIPQEKVTVVESGINTKEELLTLEEAGFDAALIGTALMKARDIGEKLREFTGI